MSRIQRAVQNDVKALELLRDELKLQTHLLKADARARWQELEAEWSKLKEHLQRAEVASGDAESEVSTATKLLIDALKAGYTQIKNALKM